MPTELRWLSKQIRPLLRLHVGSFLCITVGSVLGLLTPLVLRWLIDQILPRRHMGLLIAAVGLIFPSYEGKTVLTSLGNYLMLSAAQRTALALRLGLLRHLDTLSADYYENTPVGTAIYPLKEPIDEIAYFASDLLPAILRTFLTTCLTLATMLMVSPVLTAVVLPLVPIFLITRQHFRRKLVSDSEGVQYDRLAWSNFLEEHLSSAIPIQLLGQERRQERRAFQLLALIVRSQHGLFRTAVWFTVSTSLAIVLTMSAVIGYGGWGVVSGTLSLGSLVAFYSFVTQLFDPLSGAAELYTRAQKTFASVRQVQGVLAIRPNVAERPGATALLPKDPLQIDFVTVEFGYRKQKWNLRIPSLHIVPGEQVTLAGENGSGKSTLAKLIARIYDADAGSVRIGTKDVRSLCLESLRQQVCYLPREPVLFDGTLASNLRFVRPTTSDRELHAVIRHVGLSSLVATLPDGLRQRVGPGGCQLSSGQRQRLAIARALLQEPQILILDEATSCLDPSSEALLLLNIRHCLCSATLIVISHRLSTISSFQRVIVLSGGRIVEDGSPHALISFQSGAYSQLFSDSTATVNRGASPPRL